MPILPLLHRAGNNYTSIISTALGIAIGTCTIMSIIQMYWRLHTPAPASSDLHLRTGAGKHVDPTEFYVSGGPDERSTNLR